MFYDEIIANWREKNIRTAADIALEMNGNGAAFIYHSAKIENDSITYHDTREIFDHGGVTSYTGDVRYLLEIQNSVAAYYRMLDAFEKRELIFEARGWTVLRIWECELKKKNEASLVEHILRIMRKLP